ncbi:MAG: hypothetical protein R3F49_19945 [Planctomycetota bacterium]
MERPGIVTRSAPPVDRATRGPRRCIGVVAALCALTAPVALVGARPGSLDDAFVVLVSARSLASRGYFGWVESGGDAGCTSLLDVLQKAFVVGATDPLAASGWLGLAWLALAAGLAGALSWWLSAGVAPTMPLRARWHAAPRLALALAAALTPGLVEGTAYFLETPLFGALWAVSLGAAAAARPRVAFGLALLLPLARPEGHVLGPAAWLAAAFVAGRSPQRIARGAVAVVLAQALLLGARAALLGSLFPSSYYAKSSDTLWFEVRDGLDYVAAFGATPAGVALGLAVALGLSSALWSSAGRTAGPTAPEPASSVARGATVGTCRPRRPLALAALGLVALVVVVGSGGDGYLGARLLMPATLALWCAVAAAVPLTRTAAHGGVELGVLGLAALASALLALWVPLVTPLDSVRALVAGPTGLAAFAPDRGVTRALEDALGPASAPRATPPDPMARVLAHRHAQRFAWFAPHLELLDLTGLTDPEVARLPAPGPVRFGRDALELALECGVGALHLDHQLWRPRAWWSEPAVEALSDPSVADAFLGRPLMSRALAQRFAASYVLATLEDAWGRGRHVNVLVRRDLAPNFRRAGFTVGG